MARSAQDLKREWLASLAHERRASKHTLRAYGDDLERFLAFIAEHKGRTPDDRMLEKLVPADIRAFVTKRRNDRLGGRGVQRALAAVRSFFRYLAREGILENAAPRAVRTPRIPRSLPRPLSENDAARTILEAETHDVEWLAARDGALLTLLYGAGLRISEALGLKRGDVPLGASLSVVGKGRKERSVPLLPAVRDAMEHYTALIPFGGGRDAPLFLSRRGKPMSAREAQLLMQRLRSRLGLSESATPHALRHSFATHLLANGGELRAVQELLGHASLATTQTYTEIDAKKMMDVYSRAHPRGKTPAA
jgi:integrase/recombinase XerC